MLESHIDDEGATWRETDAPPPAGDNGGPEIEPTIEVFPYDPKVAIALKERAEKCARAATDIVVRGEITTEERAGVTARFLGRAMDLSHDIDTAKKVAEKPHSDALAKIKDVFGALKSSCVDSKAKVDPLQQAYVLRLQAENETSRRDEIEETRRRQAEAEQAAADALESGDAEAAEQMSAVARQAQYDRKAVRSAPDPAARSDDGTTSFVTTTKTAHLKPDQMFRALSQFLEEPELITLLETLATRRLRAKGGPDRVPGFETRETKNVVTRRASK